MAITLDEAKTHLNIDLTDTTDDTELTFFVAAANEWIATQVTDPDLYSVQLATRELVRHWWETQRGPAAGPLDDAGEFSLGPLGFAIPHRVEQLLAPFRVSNVPAATSSFPDAVTTWPDETSAVSSTTWLNL